MMTSLFLILFRFNIRITMAESREYEIEYFQVKSYLQSLFSCLSH